ncbi:hypothetical protein GF323_03140 [Candidatus Woesearchaeota archaeon]|nr:hypothetical protein [Candidatus Woesearchaeota archaeon]
MKLKIIIAIFLIAVIGCVNQDSANVPGIDSAETPENQKEVGTEAREEGQSSEEQEERQSKERAEEELSCEEHAKKLIPKIVKMTLANDKKPDTGYWALERNTTWKNGKKLSWKGDVKYQKGRHEGENINYYYTRNIQNEKLFGVGGWKYSEKVIAGSGVAGENEFILKPVFREIRIVKEPSLEYVGTFEIIDYNFQNCTWIG